MNLEEITNNDSNKILIHSLIWCFLIIASLLPFYQNFTGIDAEFYVQWSTGILLFYVNYFYLVPHLLLHKKYAAYLSIIFIAVVFFSWIKIYYFSPEFHHFPHQKLFDANGKEFIPEKRFLKKPPPFFKFFPSLFYLFVITISTIIKTLSEFYSNQQNKLISETRKTTSELNYLRKQTNPHFLFNALNSIYSLAYKKSDLVPDAIVTLSEMMRYMLYETDNKAVSLEKEINYIKNYIDLQKLRLNNIENIFINIHGDTRNKSIEPLLLISFIENAFKYGTDYKGKTFVKIKISIEDNILNFWIENRIENQIKDPNNSGIGLTNIKNRLNILYPNAHQLTITQTDNIYSVHLNLKLEPLEN
ncbi:sensor histidine kinase [Flavobacterium seoulense]|uniref:Histidine kinase n=1 Tax=Flavobacterium seoulense TaxID=1492738 RepID=A0A066X1W1_9FLAO|nr:histidine kinase [Flavobacterium seoulense]KDN56855.1 histidine kinase [Flavobacterium seoulense]